MTKFAALTPAEQAGLNALRARGQICIGFQNEEVVCAMNNLVAKGYARVSLNPHARFPAYADFGDEDGRWSAAEIAKVYALKSSPMVLNRITDYATHPRDEKSYLEVRDIIRDLLEAALSDDVRDRISNAHIYEMARDWLKRHP